MRSETARRDFFREIFKRRKGRFTLRMAPMIDVVFLLLLFFLVAAKWRPQEDFLPLQLAGAGLQQRNFGKPEPLTIHILATQTGCLVQIGPSRSVKIENETIEQDLALLIEETRKSLRAQKRYVTDPIEIVCSGEVKWEHLAKIYNLFFGAGLTDITFRMTE